MKKILAMLLTAMIVVSLVACRETKGTENEVFKETTSQSLTTTQDSVEEEPNDVLGEIMKDFEGVTTNLTNKLEDTFNAVGSTYEDYKKNKEFIDEWLTLVLSESDALFARTKEKSITYFKLIAEDEDHKYSEFCEEALDEYYDTVYEDALDEYYEVLYEDALDDLYDEYYDGIIEDALDDVDYDEWSEVSDDSYQQWDDADTAIYDKWDEEDSYLYGLWSAMESAFCWDENFDVDAIVSEYDREIAEETEGDTEHNDFETYDSDEEDVEVETYETVEDNTDFQTNETDSTEDNVIGIRPEFKEAMDSYEAFYTDYCEFMEKYKANPTDLTLLSKYTNMLLQAEEMTEAFEEWESDELNDEELKYYLDVSNRVAQMLLDSAG